MGRQIERALGIVRQISIKTFLSHSKLAFLVGIVTCFIHQTVLVVVRYSAAILLPSHIRLCIALLRIDLTNHIVGRLRFWCARIVVVQLAINLNRIAQLIVVIIDPTQRRIRAIGFGVIWKFLKDIAVILFRFITSAHHHIFLSTLKIGIHNKTRIREIRNQPLHGGHLLLAFCQQAINQPTLIQSIIRIRPLFSSYISISLHRLGQLFCHEVTITQTQIPIVNHSLIVTTLSCLGGKTTKIASRFIVFLLLKLHVTQAVIGIGIHFC